MATGWHVPPVYWETEMSRRLLEPVDRKAIIASAEQIIRVANEIASKTRRYDLVVASAAIIKLCGGRE